MRSHTTLTKAAILRYFDLPFNVTCCRVHKHSVDSMCVGCFVVDVAFFCQLDTSYSHPERKNINLGMTSIKLAVSKSVRHSFS